MRMEMLFSFSKLMEHLDSENNRLLTVSPLKNSGQNG